MAKHNIETRGWIKLGLPNDIKLLKEMIKWEDKYGGGLMVDIMKNKLKQLEEK